MNVNKTNNTKQAAWVALGSFCSYMVGIVSPMILSRVFDKADYGTYKQVMYVYSTLLIVFTLGLPRAYSYFIPKRPIEEAKDIITKLTAIFVVLGGVFSLTLLIFASPIASLLNNPDLAAALRYFSPVPLLLLPTMGLEGVLASFKRTEYLAGFTIVTRIMTVILTVLPVFVFGGTYIEAIIGFDIASLLTCIYAIRIMGIPVKGIAHVKTIISYRDVFKFALPLLYASIWGMIINSATQFFISRYYGNEVFADFSNGFMELPFVGMVISAIAAVLLPAFSRMDQGQGMQEEVYTLWTGSVIKSAKIIFPMLVYCVFFARLMMVCMYGDIYDSSAIYFQIKNLSGLFYIIPFAPILIAVGKTKDYANIHMITAFLIVISEFVVVKTINDPVAVAVTSELCRIIFVYLMLAVIAKYASKSISKLLPLKDLMIILISTMIAGGIDAILCMFLSINKFIVLGVSFLLFIVVYYFLCWALKISYKEFVTSLLPSRFNSLIIKYIP